MIRASSVLFWFGLTIVASLALYHTSDRVHELDQQLHDLNASIDSEQQSIHVLRAEWGYLANPARVEAEAKRHLIAMRPTAPQQVVSLNNLAEILPTRQEAMASVSVTTTPIATIKTSLAVSPRPYPLPRHKLGVIADSGHLRNYMIMQRTASVQPLDSIGALLDTLNSHP